MVWAAEISLWYSSTVGLVPYDNTAYVLRSTLWCRCEAFDCVRTEQDLIPLDLARWLITTSPSIVHLQLRVHEAIDSWLCGYMHASSLITGAVWDSDLTVEPHTCAHKHAEPLIVSTRWPCPSKLQTYPSSPEL